jgi:hypothetical protein
MANKKTERLCRSRSAADKARTLIRLKKQMVRNLTPSDEISDLQQMSAVLEISRQIVALGYDDQIESQS